MGGESVCRGNKCRKEDKGGLAGAMGVRGSGGGAHEWVERAFAVATSAEKRMKGGLPGDMCPRESEVRVCCG